MSISTYFKELKTSLLKINVRIVTKNPTQDKTAIDGRLLTPVIEFKPEDIFIIGYPKSGNTWLQNICGGLLFGYEPRLVPEALVQELVPDVHFRKTYLRFSSPMFFKSHHLPHESYRKVINIVRDGRDVLVSMYHHLQAMGNKSIEIEELIDSPFGKFGTWSDHVLAWKSNPFNAEILTIRYEDLVLEPHLQFKKICDFCGLERSQEVVDRVVMGTSFKNMQFRERVYGPGNSAWPQGKSFFRRGIVGCHVDELTALQRKKYEESHSEALFMLGYL